MSEEISQLSTITSAASGDLLVLVDVDDVSMAASGSTRNITAGNLVASLALTLQAATSTSGVALINGTQTIVSWSAPADGALHWAQPFGTLNVGTTEVGGQVSLVYTGPSGAVNTVSLWSSGLSAGEQSAAGKLVVVKAGTTVSIQQTAALTGGAATVYAGLWVL